MNIKKKYEWNWPTPRIEPDLFAPNGFIEISSQRTLLNRRMDKKLAQQCSKPTKSIVEDNFPGLKSYVYVKGFFSKHH
jgi:hypothetical protein